MGNDKKILLNKLPEKMRDFLRPETARKVMKIWEDFAGLYKHVSDWQANTSSTDCGCKQNNGSQIFHPWLAYRKGMSEEGLQRILWLVTSYGSSKITKH